MTYEENKIIEEFKRIKKLGWIRSVNNRNNGVGLTFESLLGIEQNELEIPDYNGVEIKAKRITSKSYISLFSCKPEGKYYHEVERIKDTYGYPHQKYSEYKVLNNSVYGNVKNKIGISFYFCLDISYEERKIYLCVYNIKNKLIEREVYWDFETLEEKLYRKMRVLALVKAYFKKNEIDGFEYFKYTYLNIYRLKDFNKFLELIKKGIIRISFKLNIDTSPDKLGKIHDHGTSFDILEKDLGYLYNQYIM